MEDFNFIIALVFILFASAKTYILIKYFRVFEQAAKYLLLPNVLLSSLFIISLILSLKDYENLQKIAVLVLTLLGGLTDVIGRKNKNKILIVLSLLFYLYVVGISLTKSLTFIFPFWA